MTLPIRPTAKSLALSFSLEAIVVNAPAGATISDRQWTIPGKTVKDWDVQWTDRFSPTSASVIPLTILNQSTVAFHWVDGGDGRGVKHSLKVDGVTYEAEATFDVKRPTSQIKSTTNNNGQNDGCFIHADTMGFLILQFGSHVPPDDAPGISFERQNYEVPSGFSGETQWVQIANVRRYRTLNSGQPQRYIVSGLDSMYPYPTPPASPESTADSPALRLRPADPPAIIPLPPFVPVFEDTITDAAAEDSFSMYLMFKPDTTGSIWVPLRW